MSSWISGCRLKKYNEPMTEEMLQRLHVTKERKIQQDTIKKNAQEEARERAARLRKQWANAQK